MSVDIDVFIMTESSDIERQHIGCRHLVAPNEDKVFRYYVAGFLSPHMRK